MGCLYDYKGHVFQSELALDDFLIENGKLVSKYGDMVFSRTSRANFTYDILMDKKKETDKLKAEYVEVQRQWREDGESYEVKPPFIGVTTFLSGLRVNGNLLFPEFRLEEFWMRKKERWANGEFTPDEVEALFQKVDGNYIVEPIVDDEVFNTARKLIEDKWEAQGVIGTEIHKVMQKYWSQTKDGKNVRDLPDDFLLNIYLPSVINSDLVPPNVLAQTLKYCRELNESLQNQFGDDGELTFLPEFVISGNTSEFGEDGDPTKLLGIIDLLVIDGKGNVHVIDYKTSPKSYGNYSEAKKLTFKYQLGVYNRLLRSYGINTSNSKMIVAPIELLDFKNNGDKWTYSGIEPFAGLTQDLTATIKSNERINDNLDEFLPAPFIKKSSTEKLMEEVTSTMSKWFPKYSFGKEVTDELVQKEMEENAAKDEETGKWKFHPKGSHMRPIMADTEEELFVKIKKWMLRQPLRRMDLTQTIKNGLEEAIKQEDPDYSFPASDKLEDEEGTTLWFQQQLGKYCNRNWEVLECEPAEYLGVILLRNKLTNQIDVVKITTSIVKYNRMFGKGRQGLTGAFEPDMVQATKSKSLMLESVNGNIELMEAMLVLNNMPELFEGNALVGNVQVMNPNYNSGLAAGNRELLYCFNELDKHSKVGENAFKNERIKMSTHYDLAKNRFNEILFFGNESRWSSYKNWKPFTDVSSKLDACVGDPSKMLIELKALAKRMENDPVFKTGVTRVQKDVYDVVKNPHIQIYNEVLLAIAELQGYDFRQQIADHDKWLETISIFHKGLSGTYIDNPGNLNSETLNTITKAVTEAYQNVRADMEEPKSKVRELVEKLKKSKGFNYLKERTTGNQASLYKNMFRYTEDGDILFKNPDSPTAGLESNEEREFLRYVLTEINKRRFSDRTEGEIEELKNNSDSIYYRVPLAAGNMASMASVKGMLQAAKDKFQDWNPKTIVKRAKIKMEGFLTEDIAKTEGTKMNNGDLWEMTNMFDWGEDSERRLDIIAERGIGFFESNLETLVLKYDFAHSMKKNLDNVFPTIKAAMIHLSTSGILQNTKFTADMEYLENYVKNKIFGKSIVPEKYRKWTESGGKLMQVASRLTLAFAPVQFTYQLLDGIWKDISLIIRKPDGQDSFTFKNMKDAYLFAMGDLFKSGNGKSKCELLNELYGLNDMDMNTYVDRIKSDTHGFWNFWNSLAFKFASRPDFYNRLTIFGAQMRGDGTWDAYSVKDGKLVYDWKLDKRFEAFANGRKSDAKYKEQEGLYYSMAQQLVKEHTKNADGTDFQIGQPLPKAYTTEQSENYKSLSDMIYGYYSHEKKSMIHSTGLGALFMQFHTYWSGKKNQYLAPGGIKTMGKMEQYEENGQKYWYKLDENGNVTYEPTTEDTGIPFMTWKGQWQEGVLLTIIKTAGDIWSGVKEGNIREGWNIAKNDIWNNEDEGLRRAYRSNLQQICYDLTMLALIGGLLSGWLSELLREQLKETKDSDRIADALVNTIASIGVRTVDSSADDLNFVKSIGGIGMTWTPFSFDFARRMITTWSSVLGGDRDAYDAFVNSASFTRQTKPLWDFVKPQYLIDNKENRRLERIEERKESNQ